MNSQRELDFNKPADFPEFDGEPEPASGVNRVRLSKQLRRVWDLMKDGQWRTYAQISNACVCSENSAGARLRDFRKVRIMGAGVCHVARRKSSAGVYVYRVHSIGGCDDC